MKHNEKTLGDIALLATLCAICAGAGIDLVRWGSLGALVPFTTMLVIELIFLTLAFSAWRARFAPLLLIPAVASCCLFYTMNYQMYPLRQYGLLVQSIASVLGLCIGTYDLLRHKRPIRPIPALSLALAGVTVLAALGAWGWHTYSAKTDTGRAVHQTWAVPTQFDSADCAQAGRIVELTYDTRAYATDSRAVQKRALVYLPYGYDSEAQYNILYLMHGTGQDETSWFTELDGANKSMLDHLIASGEIEPLIVVTPTFYTQNDCADDLDQLTYAFADELRNDLMPAVESTYSTYAESIDDAGFSASRSHRAFAGLSRGSVTACHSALCNNLDFFANFGLFSAYRTEDTYLAQTLLREAYADLSIDYLYMTSGAFDFALPDQITGFARLIEQDARLTQGVNADFDIFPMRYHSMGNWHLALYNFLLRIF